MNNNHESKINWFCLRTGSSKEEAKKFLILSKYKLEIAIQLRNQENDRLRETT